MRVEPGEHPVDGRIDELLGSDRLRGPLREGGQDVRVLVEGWVLAVGGGEKQRGKHPSGQRAHGDERGGDGDAGAGRTHSVPPQAAIVTWRPDGPGVESLTE
jgi:hypothetical protein